MVRFKQYDVVVFPDNEIGFINDICRDVKVNGKFIYRYSIVFLTENNARHKTAWYGESPIDFKYKSNLIDLTQHFK